MNGQKALIIEDDPEICELLSIHLKDMGIEVECKGDGKEGLDQALNYPADLIVLDIMLPGMDGIEICQKIRSKEINTPIIMLTAKSEEIDRVLGLEIGADDYMTKPFSIREFLARVKAIFRRTQVNQEEEEREKAQGPMIFEDLRIEVEKRKVMLGEKKIDLSPKEFELLVLMASNPGKSYSRSRLLNLIWGYDFEGYEHTVNSHINRLRAKIEKDMNEPRYILTSWGVGYSFNEEMVKA